RMRQEIVYQCQVDPRRVGTDRVLTSPPLLGHASSSLHSPILTPYMARSHCIKIDTCHSGNDTINANSATASSAQRSSAMVTYPIVLGPEFYAFPEDTEESLAGSHAHQGAIVTAVDGLQICASRRNLP